MNIEIEEPLAARIEELVRQADGIAPVSAESIVHMAVEAFLEGAGA